MKKLKIISAVLLLMISLAACSGGKTDADDIYEKIHSLYYNIQSYSANCNVTVFSKDTKNTYNCKIAYDSSQDTYDIVSDDMKIFLSDEKTVISKGENTIESPSLPEDMYIFINTFFKSYYQSEDTVLSVNAADNSSVTLLECSAATPTDYIASMKLWIDTSTALPTKMQVLDSQNKINTQIDFIDFTFEKQSKSK